MRKKWIYRIMTVLLCVLMLAGCGNSGSGSTKDNHDTADDAGTKQQTDNAANLYADNWIGKLKPTGQTAKEYPFEQLGNIKGYLPGMLPDAVRQNVESLGMGFDSFHVHAGGGYSAKESWTESEEVYNSDQIEVTIKNRDPAKDSSERVVKYALYNPFEKGQKYQVKDALANGTYQVIVEAPSGGYLRGGIFGLKDKDGNDAISGAALMDAIVDQWGMPSYVYTNEVVGVLMPYLCYETKDYIVMLHIIDSSAKAVRLTSVHVFDIRYKAWMEQYIGVGRGASKWEP